MAATGTEHGSGIDKLIICAFTQLVNYNAAIALRGPRPGGSMKPKTCHAMQSLPADALGLVAAYFQTLSEPTRLQILNRLREGEANVGELATTCECSVANVSRHLALLSKHGLVDREGRGANVYYRIADPAVYALCDLVCGNISRHLERNQTRRHAFLR